MTRGGGGGAKYDRSNSDKWGNVFLEGDVFTKAESVEGHVVMVTEARDVIGELAEKLK